MIKKNDTKECLYSQIYWSLFYAIASDVFKPGQHIKENYLANYYHMSRTPIRKALSKLEDEGIVIRDRGHAVITSLSRQETVEVFEVRETLERLAIQEAIKRISATGIASVDKANARFKEVLSKGNTIDIVTMDMEFHKTIFKLADNRVLIDIIDKFDKTLNRFRIKSFRAYDNKDEISMEHERIIDALKKRNVEQAETAAINHLMSQKEKLLSSFSA